MEVPTEGPKTSATAGSSPKVEERGEVNIHSRHAQIDQGSGRDNDDVVSKYWNFMKFDIVEDYSDHHFAKSISKPSGNWAKKIQEEWRILMKNLPDTIYVRVYESRMDLLRAAIKGAEGTPYHDGLFFFDVCFPNNYPREPPKVYYHSGGLRINPNLYNNGKVCLSLLNTWAGAKDEKWTPGVSTMLQVLVSIQGLILNRKPYFNEPGYARNIGSIVGEYKSMSYNEAVLIYSLKTMVYTMKKPPKHFEDLVIGHFRVHAHDILKTFKAYYTEGIGIRCGVDNINGKKRSSTWFKNNAKSYMNTVISAFKHIGVENVDYVQKSLAEKILNFLCCV